MAKGPKFPLAIVEWWDAHQSQTERTYDEILKEHKASLIRTHGYVVIDNEVGVWVSSEWLPGDPGSPDTYRQHTFIPRGMLHKITYRGRRRGRPERGVGNDANANSDPGSPARAGSGPDVGGA